MSAYLDAMYSNTYAALRQMSASTSTSKAFRAQLTLQDHEIPIVQRWASFNCALYALFRSDRGAIVLVGLRNSPQTSASFARTLRNVLRRASASTQGLRGHWLFLISEREAISVCVGSSELPLGAPSHPEERPRIRGHTLPPGADEDSEDSVVDLLR
jgi:hypothetical protein